MRRAAFIFPISDSLAVHVVPAFKDNYLYILVEKGSSKAAFIDPGDAEPLVHTIETYGLKPEFIFLTHHHRDHSGGVQTLLERWNKTELVCSPWLEVKPEWKPARLTRLTPGAHFPLWSRAIQAIDVRGHTLDHIAFLLKDSPRAQGSDVFVGDSLFGAGCGGLFEGTHPQMLEALKALRALPDAVRAWCAHEYTIKNLRVARLLQENNPLQQARLAELEDRLAEEALEPHEWVTLPLSLEEEKATNPFLRWDVATLQKAIDTHDDLDTFSYVRSFRDRF
ncbi:MAG: hydroxyacylglutathione hydrolase [Betaproteobacteria bacterium]|nr:hydroxyacylglutathione hydrolase [Betaproteobacteria bacterium]